MSAKIIRQIEELKEKGDLFLSKNSNQEKDTHPDLDVPVKLDMPAKCLQNKPAHYDFVGIAG